MMFAASRLFARALLLAGSVVAPHALATGLDSMDAFVKAARSGRASFTQVVTSPAKEGQAVRSKTSSGSFEFQRPGRFRFTYKKPFEQTLVALIAAAPDMKALQGDFELRDAPDRDGLQWVQATPRTKDGQLQAVRVGFRVTDKGSELAVLDILDSFGQRSVLTFTAFELNPVLAPSVFQFKPPAGADVIRP